MQHKTGLQTTIIVILGC